MRKDICINTSLGDLVLADTAQSDIYLFRWVSEDDLFVLGEIIIPSTYDVRKLQTEGVEVEIPYTPIYKPIKIRIMRSFDLNTNIPVINPVNGGEWFEIHTLIYNKTDKQICASQLLTIDLTSYIIQIDNKSGTGKIWSAISSDAVCVNANNQNKILMLQCVPSNHYRYPTSGVGLIRYLHSNLGQSDLANVLYNEFMADKVKVRRALFDNNTGDIDLDLDFSETDGEIYN